MLPLLYFGPEAYIAGVAANAAAEKMYGQLAQGQLSNDALTDGVLAAAVEVAKGKLGDVKIPINSVLGAIGVDGKSTVSKIISGTLPEVTKETANYFLDYLLDKVWEDPDAEGNIGDWLRSVIAGGTVNVFGKKAEDFFNSLDDFR